MLKQVMRKIFFVFIMLAAIIFVTNSVFASAPAPSPKCYIEGTIQSVEFKEAYNESCLTEEYGCPTDMEYYHPARYFFKIKIDSVSYVSGETDFVTCEDMLPLNTEQTIFINKDKVKMGDSFEPNQKINGQVSSFWGKSFDSYTLVPQCTVNSDCYPQGFTPGKCGTFYTCSGGKCYEGSAECPVSTEQVKITPEQALSKATEITTIKKIELKEENTKPVYSIKGTKQAKLLFIISVSLEVETKVDAKTGNVISINKPWWSFLAW